MSNQTDRRTGGQADRLIRLLISITATGLLSVCPSARLSVLSAQVGHDPAHSPFHDITTRQSLTLMGGNFFGNTARAGVGAQAGTLFGVRLRSRLSGPLDITIGASLINSKRMVIDPTKPDSVRRSGPIDYGLIAADIGLSLTLTGAKTWHGFAPWIGFGFGVVTPTSSRTDPGGYRAGTNFSIVPSVGMHLILTRKLGLAFEARDNTMRYEWPLAYFNPTDASGNSLPPPVLAIGERDRQLTHNFSIMVGVSYHFNF